MSSYTPYCDEVSKSKKKKQANYDEVKTRLCGVCFVVFVVNVVVAVLIVGAVHKVIVVVDKSLSDTH